MKFSEFVEKESKGEAINKQPAHLTALDIGRSITNITGWIVILLIVGAFASYGFLKGLIFLLGGAIFWFIFRMIVGWITVWIVKSLMK